MNTLIFLKKILNNKFFLFILILLLFIYYLNLFILPKEDNVEICRKSFSEKEWLFIKNREYEKVFQKLRIIEKNKTAVFCYLHISGLAEKKDTISLINLYRDGEIVDSYKPINNKKNYLKKGIENIKGHDYLIEFINNNNEVIVISHPETFYSEDYKAVNTYFIKPYEDYFPTFNDQSIGIIDKDLYFYIIEGVFKNLTYVVKRKPSSKWDKINRVDLYYDKPNYLVKIYGEDINGNLLGPIEQYSLSDPYVLVKYNSTFNNHAFLWDESFISWFLLDIDLNLSISTLDFFYSLQISNGDYKGLIPREIRTENYYLLQKNPNILQQNINKVSYFPLSSTQISNPFFLSRIELELFRRTDNIDRLEKIYPQLKSYFSWLEKHRRKTKFISRINKFCPYYWTSNFGSGMDNIGRGPGESDGEQDILSDNYGWIDVFAQQIALSEDLAIIARILGKIEENEYYDKINKQYKELFLDCYYDKESYMFWDLDFNGDFDKQPQTIAFIWALYAKAVDENELDLIINDWLINPAKFGGFPPIPSIARDDKDFNDEGNYWQGGIWPPYWWLTIYSLKDLNKKYYSYQLSKKVIESMSDVFKIHRTVYEFYSPTLNNDHIMPGRYNNIIARDEFLGWGSIPIPLIIQFFGGIEELSSQELVVNIYDYREFIGIKNYKVNNGEINLEVIKREKNSVILDLKTDLSENLSLYFIDSRDNLNKLIKKLEIIAGEKEYKLKINL